MIPKYILGTLLLATAALSACGGRLDDVGLPGAPSGTLDASDEDAGVCAPWLPADGSGWNPTVQCATIREDIPDGNGSPDGGPSPVGRWENGYVFDSLDSFLAFFDGLAIASSYVDPSRGLDCALGASLLACPYDPRVPRSSAADIHESDALNRFVGPDGHDYAWVYVQERNAFVLGDSAQSAAAYGAILSCTCALTSGTGAAN